MDAYWQAERRAALRRIVGLAILIRLETQRLRHVEGRLGLPPATVGDAEQVCLGEEVTWAWAQMPPARDVLRLVLGDDENNTCPEERADEEKTDERLP